MGAQSSGVITPAGHRRVSALRSITVLTDRTDLAELVARDTASTLGWLNPEVEVVFRAFHDYEGDVRQSG